MTVELLDTQCVCSASAERRKANMESALSRGLPVAGKLPQHNRSLAIVGGGPSVSHDLDALALFAGEIWSVNGSLGWLNECGIISEGHVLLDPEPMMARYVENAPDWTTYYVASICDPAVFDALRERNVIVWHPGMADLKPPNRQGMIGGGPTVLSRAPMLAFCLGYSDVHLFGADSSYEGERHHVYDAPRDPAVAVELDGVTYDSCAVFVHQAAYFQQISHFFQHHGAMFEIHGRGLGPAILKAKMHGMEDFAA